MCSSQLPFHFIFHHNMPNQRRLRRRRRRHRRRGHSSWHSHHSHQTLFRLSIRHSTPLNTFGNNATSQSATATTTSSNNNQQQQQSVTTTTTRGRSRGNANRLPFTCIYAYLSTIIFVYWPQKLWRHADSASKCCKEKNERRMWKQGWGQKEYYMPLKYLSAPFFCALLLLLFLFCVAFSMRFLIAANMHFTYCALMQ